MALGSFCKLGIKCNSLDVKDLQLNLNLEEVVCPICLEFPHNGVLLQCSSNDKGCRPFICDTGLSHSNCLERFKSAYRLTEESITDMPSECGGCLICPLCRGSVTGWVIVDDARVHFNLKTRSCEEKHCSFVGNYVELQNHAKLEHPHSHPSEVDPARKIDWENFQQSSEIIDVLSTIHAEVPHGVVLGDYVIEYGDDNVGDDYEEFPRVRGNWFTSCILYKVFNSCRSSRNRRRSGARETRSQRNSSFGSSSLEGGPSSSPESSDNNGVRMADDFIRRSRRHSTDRLQSYRRRRSRH